MAFRQATRSVVIGVGVALLVLIVLEVAGRVGLSLIQPGRLRLDPAAFNVPQGTSSITSLAEEYSREMAASYKTQWRSYVYWRRAPYRGKYINVDEAGIRRSWNSTAAPSPNQLKILVFGGSTLWGTGARDEFTIPSLLSKRLSSQLPAGVWVTNFGESGYVNTQEAIALLLELRKGNVPDVAVFYDGYNDAASAVQSGVAGIPQNEENRAIEFNSRSRLNFRAGFVNRLALYRFSRSAVRLFARRRAGSGEGGTSMEPLAKGVVDAYLRNVEIVNSLASHYGFQAVFFWQPTLYTKKNLSQAERRRYAESERFFGRGGPLFGMVDNALKERLAKREAGYVFDLSGVFGEDGRTVFIDQSNHLSEAGNDTVADAMAKVLLTVVREKKK